MEPVQKILIVRLDGGLSGKGWDDRLTRDEEDRVNAELAKGWRVESVAPMGGAGGGGYRTFGAIIVLRRD